MYLFLGDAVYLFQFFYFADVYHILKTKGRFQTVSIFQRVFSNEKELIFDVLIVPKHFDFVFI